MIGSTISHYKILEKLGEGGMGVVYKAQDLKLDRLVALKFLPPHLAADEDDKKRFTHEAKAASSLDHPNICNVHEVDETPDGQLFIAMAIYDGASLSKKIEKSPLKIEEALDIATQVAEGLQIAHEKGITHRDIKSSNVIVTEKGRAIIMDFGLARSAGATQLTKTGSTLGTVPYMSPEQARGEKVDHRSDIWSLGAVIYEMVTGQLPFRSQYNEAIVYSILNENPQPLTALRSGIPMELERIVHKCLEKNPSGRYQHADELMVDLQKIKSQIGKTIPPSKPSLLLRSKSFLYAGVVLALALVVLLALPLFRAKEESIKSIAVLPLENLSRDPEQEYFADGMTEALITNLAKIGALRVISRTSVMHYKTTKKTIPEIAKELNVDAVVEGSVQRSGDRVRITAQLLHAPTDRHLWAESYERDLTDVLALQSELALAITKEIRAKVTPDEEVRLTSVRPVNKEAHDLYLRGNFFMHKSDEENLNRALVYFRQALDKDPGYALPYAGIAFTYSFLADAYLPPKDAYPKAKIAALKALELDSTIADARAVLAFTLGHYDRDPASADREFRRAIDFNPNSVDGRTLFAFFLSTHLDQSEALAQLDHAMSLDPLSPYPSWAKEWVLLWAREYDQVIEQHKRTAALEPNFFYIDSFVGAAHREKGMFKEALDEYLKVQNLAPEQPLYGLAITYARMGKRTEARKILRDLEVYSTKRYIPKSAIGMVYAALGDKDRAFEWFDRAYQDRDVILVVFAVTPENEPVRSDPRFTNLLKNMGLQAPETDKGSSSSSIEKPKTESSPKWQNSIAVLPFKNISADKEQEYFCDGMTEQLITNLTNVPNVKVIARTSVMQFKNSVKTIQQIAQELGVVHVLEGSVRKAGNKIRVTAQLIKADDGFHLWAKEYDRQLKDIFAVQDDVSKEIVAALKINLTGKQKAAVTKRYTENTEAYQLYLQGRYYWNKRTEEGFKKAIERFQQALDMDPNYALAYAGLADCYALLGFVQVDAMTPMEAMAKAKAAVLKALEIDSELAEARTSLAFVKAGFDWDWLGAEEEYKHALELNSGYSTAHDWYANYLEVVGRNTQALAESKKALELDPLSLIINKHLGWRYYFIRQYDQAIEQYHKTLELDRNFIQGHLDLGKAYLQKSMFTNAVAEFRKAAELSGGSTVTVAALGHAYAISGERSKAMTVLNELRNELKKRYVPSYLIAEIYVGLGQKDQAFEWLEKAYRERSGYLIYLKVEPRLDSLRSDPRFIALLKKVGLEK